MASAVSAYIIVIELGDQPRVLKRFEHHRMQNVVIGERVVKGRQRSQETEDVDMEDASEPSPVKEDGDSSDEEAGPSKPVIATVARMAVSPDGEWLATSDDHRRTHIFNLDLIQYHCVLPSFPQATHALAFDRAAPSTLVLGLANNTIQVYDVAARTFPAWARGLIAALPRRFTHLHDPILGVAFDLPTAEQPARRGSALFWGASWLCRVQLDAGVGYGGFDKKRRWGGQKPSARPPANLKSAEDAALLQQDNFKLVTHYRPVLFADFIASGELVIVERPLVDVLAKLPPAFFKPKYGAT